MLGARQSGQFGQIMTSINDGVSYSSTALTPVASKVIDGETFTDRFIGHPTALHWNVDKMTSLPRLQGIVGSVTVTPSTTNNQVSVAISADFGVFKTNTATPQAGTANVAVTITRGATGKKTWHLIVVDIDDGTFSAVAGTDGDSFVDTFGAAGGPPLVAADKMVVCGVQTSTDTAGVILDSEIKPALSDGTILQERSDVPSFELLPLHGGILLTRALPKWHTGPLARLVYATFWSQTSTLEAAGDTIEWKISSSGSTVTMEAQNDRAPSTAPAGAMKSTVTCQAYAKTGDWFRRFKQKRRVYWRGYRNKNDTTEYYEAALVSTSFDENNAISAAIVNNAAFEVDGIVEWRGS